MHTVRINISLPKDTFEELEREVAARKRSKFITEATKKMLKERRAERLANEYKEAAEEIKNAGRDLEGVMADGLD